MAVKQKRRAPNRDHQIVVRFTAQEHKWVVKQAELDNRKPSVYVRHVVLRNKRKT